MTDCIKPIPMILLCPVCHLQHIDEVDEVTNPGWENPPHTSHKCLGCGTIWRPCQMPSEGVRILSYHGKSDTWPAIGRYVPSDDETFSITPVASGVVKRKPNPVPFPKPD